MSEDSWTDRIAAERMRVDREFEDRVAASSFSRQQWGLVMTAVEFDVEGADEPETARMVADGSSLPSVMSQIEQMGEGRGSTMGGGGGGGGGFLGSVTDALGLGGGNSALQEEAEELADEYAAELQERLEDRGRWEDICAAVAESGD